MSTNFLTLHLMQVLPWHNLNGGEHGMPKRLKQGSADRAMLSSQSLKRAARTRYEQEVISDTSVRSANHLHELIVRRAADLAAGAGLAFDERAATKKAKDLLSRLVRKGTEDADATNLETTPAKASTEATKPDKPTSIWLSDDEIGLLAHQIATGTGELSELGAGRRTGSLSIAAFGRMLAHAPAQQTDASIAVSPAVTTHRMVVELDFFVTVDDLKQEFTGSQGAGYTDVATYTTGVYYRTVTIDREQLRRSWTDFDAPGADVRLRSLVQALVMALPSGKKNSTGPYTVPALVLAEEQRSRFAYEFETPVQASDPGPGGFKVPSVTSLLAQREQVMEFDPSLIGSTVAAGVDVHLVAGAPGIDLGDLDMLVEHVVQWVRQS